MRHTALNSYDTMISHQIVYFMGKIVFRLVLDSTYSIN